MGLRLLRYATNAKRYSPQNGFGSPEFSFQAAREILYQNLLAMQVEKYQVGKIMRSTNWVEYSLV